MNHVFKNDKMIDDKDCNHLLEVLRDILKNDNLSYEYIIKSFTEPINMSISEAKTIYAKNDEDVIQLPFRTDISMLKKKKVRRYGSLYIT